MRLARPWYQVPLTCHPVLTNNTIMIVVNIGEAKARLSEYLKRVEEGETVILAKRNRPIAQIRPMQAKRLSERPFGLCAGEFRVPEDFDDPLPAEVLADFEGE